jgi:2-polyprenyl-3-methyl-5-hydroxy-6-metoxy-1,4-benzoquinol methylase
VENINFKSYQTIASHWKQVRDAHAMPNCIIDFAKDITPKAHILDVGCGTGYPIASWFAKRGFHVTGIDAVEAMIDYAKALNLPNASFILTDLMDYRPQQTFDAIVAFDVLFHLKPEQQLPALSHLAKMLNPKGSILFTHGNRQGEIDGKMFNETFYYSSLNTRDYVQNAESLGFVVTTLIENYVESTVGDRDLLMIITKK